MITFLRILSDESLAKLTQNPSGFTQFVSDSLESDFSLGSYSPLSVPIEFERENSVSIFSMLLWTQSSSNLQVTRTGIKSRKSLD